MKDMIKYANDIRYSSPSPGRTIVNSVGYWGNKLLLVLNETSVKAEELEIIDNLNDFFNCYFGLKNLLTKNKKSEGENNTKQLSSVILSVWLMGVSANNIQRNDSLLDAIHWFLGNRIEEKTYLKI